MDEVTRFFKKEGEVICVMRHSAGENSVATANTHILTDPDDLLSPAVEGWEEITENKFKVARSLVEARAKEAVRELVASEQTAQEVVYEEALKLGFTPASAASISGFTPAA